MSWRFGTRAERAVLVSMSSKERCCKELTAWLPTSFGKSIGKANDLYLRHGPVGTSVLNGSEMQRQLWKAPEPQGVWQLTCSNTL
jgi:hypothetical protein